MGYVTHRADGLPDRPGDARTEYTGDAIAGGDLAEAFGVDPQRG
ncbi:hypothetical protein [Rhodococcus sp. NPDC004095]